MPLLPDVDLQNLLKRRTLEVSLSPQICSMDCVRQSTTSMFVRAEDQVGDLRLRTGLVWLRLRQRPC